MMPIHKDLSGLSGIETVRALDGRDSYRGTCVRCNSPFAYTGSRTVVGMRAQYCPKCLPIILGRNR